jgi:uncharacterized protein with HEPN domain
MPLEGVAERDRALVLDMLLAAERAIRHLDGLDLQAFSDDELRQDAVRHCIVLVGEAARGVSTQARNAHPHIEWQRIVGMRNVLVHDYGAVDENRVWRTVHEKLPGLVEQVHTILEGR